MKLAPVKCAYISAIQSLPAIFLHRFVVGPMACGRSEILSRLGLGSTSISLGLMVIASVAQAQGLPNSGLTSLTTTPTSAQLAALQATGIKVVLPDYVPTGFQLDSVSVQANRSAKFGGYRTLVIYQKVDPVTTTSTAVGATTALPQCFAIEAITATAQPLPAASFSALINSPVFGRSQLNYGLYRTFATPVTAVSIPASNPGSVVAPTPIAQPSSATPIPTWLSEWLGVPMVVAGVATPANPVYRFVGAGTDARLANCDNVSTAEALKIAESLQFYPVSTGVPASAVTAAPVTAAPVTAAAVTTSGLK
jgi:hypothetical protein